MAINIGGDFEYQIDRFFGLDFCLTDSGRSSLRLILKSLPKKLRYALPDFLCKIIVDVFCEMKREFSYYKIKDDLSIDLDSICSKSDAIYIINYFGINISKEVLSKNYEQKFIIEDNAFLPMLINKNGFKNWASFNSFRKISVVADGSIACATFPLKKEHIVNRPSKFYKIKYRAKSMKYKFCKQTEAINEDDYLKTFEKGEETIDMQHSIYTISNKSLKILPFISNNVEHEYAIRRANLNTLLNGLESIYVDNKIIDRLKKEQYPAAAVLKVQKKEAFRRHLATAKIYTMINWPRFHEGPSIKLYDSLLSLPIDSRYGSCDLKRMAKVINQFIGVK